MSSTCFLLTQFEPCCVPRPYKRPNPGFPAVVLSLARSDSRREAMKQRLDAVQAQYTFLDAIDSQQQLQNGQAGPKPFLLLPPAPSLAAAC